MGYNYIVKLILNFFWTTMDNNFNSMSLSKSVDTVNALIDKINSTCDALMAALEFNTETVSSYNMTVIQRMNMNSEFIDRVVSNIIAMKKHLSDLKKWINGDLLMDTWDLQTIVEWLRETSDKLNELLLSDNNFNNVYDFAINEIQTLIEQVLDEIKIWEVVLKMSN